MIHTHGLICVSSARDGRTGHPATPMHSVAHLIDRVQDVFRGHIKVGITLKTHVVRDHQ